MGYPPMTPEKFQQWINEYHDGDGTPKECWALLYSSRAGYPHPDGGKSEKLPDDWFGELFDSEPNDPARVELARKYPRNFVVVEVPEHLITDKKVECYRDRDDDTDMVTLH